MKIRAFYPDENQWEEWEADAEDLREHPYFRHGGHEECPLCINELKNLEADETFGFEERFHD